MPLLSQWIKKQTSYCLSVFWWERVDSNHRRRCQQIYSLPPLATREHSHVHYSKKWSWWTDSNPRPADYKSAALPTELHQQIFQCQMSIPYLRGKVKGKFKIFYCLFTNLPKYAILILEKEYPDNKLWLTERMRIEIFISKA